MFSGWFYPSSWSSPDDKAVRGSEFALPDWSCSIASLAWSRPHRPPGIMLLVITLNDTIEASPENANKHHPNHGDSSIQCKNKDVFSLLVRIISPFNLQKQAQGLDYPSTVDPWLMLNSPIYGEIETNRNSRSKSKLRFNAIILE